MELCVENILRSELADRSSLERGSCGANASAFACPRSRRALASSQLTFAQ